MINHHLALISQAILDISLESEGKIDAKIGDIAEVIDCLHSKKPSQTRAGNPLIQLNNIRDDGLLDMTDVFLISEGDYQKWTSRCEVSEGDCVITNVGRVGAVSQAPPGLRAAMGRNMTCIRTKNTFPYPAFVITYLLSNRMRVEITNNTDRGTILDALNVKNIPLLPITILSDEKMIELENTLRYIRSMMEINLKMSARLSEIRDRLLPFLLSESNISIDRYLGAK